MFTESISYPAALFAGLLSFFSPCILPLIPAYFTFITGLSLDELTGARTTGVRARVIRATLSYVLGFSLVFVLMGASASFIGGAIFKYRDWIRIIGGLLIILLGIHMTGLLRFGFLRVRTATSDAEETPSFYGNFFRRNGLRGGMEPMHRPTVGIYPHCGRQPGNSGRWYRSALRLCRWIGNTFFDACGICRFTVILH